MTVGAVARWADGSVSRMARGPEWNPEITVDADLAETLIGAQFPELGELSRVAELAAGWDNTVFRVTTRHDERLPAPDWAFRFPRREIALAGVRREMSLLPRLAPHLPLPIPVPKKLGEPGAAFPWPFFGARLLDGHDLSVARLADDERARTAADVGSFLRSLHQVSIAECSGGGMEVDPMNRGFPKRRSVMTHERLDRLTKSDSWKMTAGVANLLDAGDELNAPAGRPVLVHGDLHVRHVLIDSRHAVTGIIDWGDACLADPSVDLSIAYSSFVGPSRAALLEAYGGIDAEREIRARVLAVSLSAALAEHASAVGDAVLLNESLAGLRRAVS